MSCERCRERLGSLLEGQLDGPDRAAIEAHLAGCPACRACRAQLEQVDQLLALVPAEEPVPAELTAAILRSAASHPAGAPRLRPRTRRIRPLVWATAAGLLLTAALIVLLARRAPHHAPEEIPGPVPAPRTVSARLYLNGMVGHLVPEASYRIYGPSVGNLLHDLTLLGIEPALSLNNLRIGLDQPHQAATADETGRIRVDPPLGTGMHLVFVSRPGFVGAWGLIQPAEEPPDLEAVLFPAVSLEVSGSVLDRTTGRPIAGAILATPDGTGVAVTGPDGRYQARMEVFPDRTPHLYAFAARHAEAQEAVARDAIARGVFRWDARLEPARRHELALRLGDGAGGVVAGAEVLAWPDLEDSARPEIPPLRRRRPELGVTDETGRVVLHDLLPCRYRLEVYHPRYDLEGPRYVDPSAGAEVGLTGRLGGDARVVATIERPDGSPLAGARVVLSHTIVEEQRARPLRVRSGATDLEGKVVFQHLRAGTAVLQVVTPDGIGYHIGFTIAAGDAVVFTYPLPEASRQVSGELDPEVRGHYRMLRVQGALPRVTVGRWKSESHVLAVEVPVADDGSFRFPPLPWLARPELLGRLARDPGGPPVELSTRPDPVAAFGREAPASVRLAVGP